MTNKPDSTVSPTSLKSDVIVTLIVISSFSRAQLNHLQQCTCRHISSKLLLPKLFDFLCYLSFILLLSFIQFEVALPITYLNGVTYTYHWPDTGVDKDTTDQYMYHTFVSAGIYNVSVTVDNYVSRYTSWDIFHIYEKVSGENVILHL